MKTQSILAVLSACLLLTTLSACTSKPKDKLEGIAYRGPALPPAPDRYTRMVPDPGGFREGVDVRVTTAENRAAYQQCTVEKSDFARWYKKQRAATLK